MRSWLRRRPASDGAALTLPAVALPAGTGAGTAVVAKPKREPIVTRAELALAFSTLIVLAGVVLGSALVQPPPVVHSVAQFVHLACVVLGLGSVLAVDWFGLRWQLGKGRCARW